VALLCAEALAREVDADERRRARGVDRHARTAKTEHVREATRCDAERVAGAEERVDLFRTALGHLELAVVVRADPDEHPGPRSREIDRSTRRVLERLPRDLEEQALLRIHRGGFARRDPEEVRVEAI